MLNKLLSASSGAQKLYSDDVFSAYTYTGNGATQPINNGIDLAGKGGMVWAKQRTSTNSHTLVDSIRGVDKFIRTNTTDAQQSFSGSGLTAPVFLNNGYVTSNYAGDNGASTGYVGWTFRRAPEFFDVVTYTGNGTTQNIAHSLGIAPGMIIVKQTSGANAWYVYHQSLGNTGYLFLNTTAAVETSVTGNVWGNGSIPVSPTAAQFSIGADGGLNTSGQTYVAYLFAHDTSADGIIQAGSFTTDASGNATVNLGWEPQYLMVKDITVGGSWHILDTSRAFSQSAELRITANWPAAEVNDGTIYSSPTATGFVIRSGLVSAGSNTVYLAIRRPNKPPTLGTQVYNAIARTGTGAAAVVTGVGFAPDLLGTTSRTGGFYSFVDKNRGHTQSLYAHSNTTEATSSSSQDLVSFDMNGISVGVQNNIYINGSGISLIHHFFHRAQGVFDIVCDTGTGISKQVAHNLSATPELIIRKCRTFAYNWQVYCSYASGNLVLQQTSAQAASMNLWTNGSVNMTPSTFSVSSIGEINAGSDTFISYLFASRSGISKIGSYVGNGSSQVINCGFTTGARYMFIKSIDNVGDWFYWDSARGIISGDDPHLSLNTSVAEVTTDDSVDVDISGFIVNQVAATNINITGGTYIFLAFA